jgi:hypothetical protein
MMAGFSYTVKYTLEHCEATSFKESDRVILKKVRRHFWLCVAGCSGG